MDSSSLKFDKLEIILGTLYKFNIFSVSTWDFALSLQILK